MMLVVAAVLAYLLLADAAIETFWHASPVRWWVAATVILYGGASVVLWRRTSWRSRTAASALVLAGTAAMTAWLPGGLTDGLNACGMPTARLLSVVAAAGVAFSACVLLRNGRLPRAIEGLVVVIAAYAVAACMYAVAADVPFASLFPANSASRRLPLLLQGAVLGGLVVVPLALIVSVSSAGLRRRAEGSRARSLQQTAALATSLALVLSGVPKSEKSAEAVREGASKPPSVQTANTPEPGPRHAHMPLDDQQLGRTFDALAGAARAIPRETFDPAAVLRLTGPDIEAIFTWVRDATTLVPYRGALRGAVGVLMDRVGNALDRSLLLQELLRRQGHEVRLARAQLNVGQAEDVFRRTRPMPVVGKPAPALEPVPTENLERQATSLGLDPAVLRQAVARIALQADFLHKQMGERTEAQASSIHALLGKPGGDPDAERAVQQEALRDHWWVQVSSGGKWLDLDPTLPDATAGTALAEAAETLTISALSDVPEALQHTVQLRLVLECSDGRGVQEHTLLETPRLQPASVVGQRILVQSVPSRWPQVLDAADDATLRRVVLEQDQWLPVLTVGDSNTVGRPYGGRCEFGAAPGPFGGLGGGVAGAFEGARGSHNGGGAGAITAEWIEYMLRVPGAPERRVRRQLFDLLGPAARASGQRKPALTESEELTWRLALLGGTEILLLAGQVSPEYVEQLVGEGILANRDALRGVLSRATDSATREDAARKLQPATGEVHTLALARRVWQALSGPVYLAQPNILSYHCQVRQGPNGGFTELKSFDIVESTVAVDVRSASSPLAVRLKQGVLDANAEALLAGIVCRQASGGACENAENTADAFQASLRQGVAWRVVRSPSDLHGLQWSDDAIWRARADVEAGHVVVLPDQPRLERPVWWRISQDGGVVGFGNEGWGQSAEYGHLVNVISFAFCWVGAGGAPSAEAQARDKALCVLGFLVGTIAVLYAANAAAIKEAAAADRIRRTERLAEDFERLREAERLADKEWIRDAYWDSQEVAKRLENNTMLAGYITAVLYGIGGLGK